MWNGTRSDNTSAFSLLFWGEDVQRDLGVGSAALVLALLCLSSALVPMDLV